MTRIVLFAALAAAALAPAAARAQYYPRDYDRPGYVPPPYRYDEDRPRYYDEFERGRARGFRCSAVAATPRGAQSVVCPLDRPRPLGFDCECPPPLPPPGYSPGPDLPGRVIR